MLLSAWLVALLVALSQAPVWGWGSGRVIGLLVVAVVVGGGWVVAEMRSAVPLIDMRMMRLPAVWTTNVVALLVGLGMYATFAFLPELLQTPTGVRLRLRREHHAVRPDPAAASVTMFVARPVQRQLTARFGGKALVTVGSVIGALSMAMLAFAHEHRWEVYLASAVMGAGIGLVFSAMAALVVAAVPAEQTGVASGMNANIRTIGGSIGVGADGEHRHRPSGAERAAEESGYTIGFAVLAGRTGARGRGRAADPDRTPARLEGRGRRTARWRWSPAAPSSATTANDRRAALVVARPRRPRRGRGR